MKGGREGEDECYLKPPRSLTEVGMYGCPYVRVEECEHLRTTKIIQIGKLFFLHVKICKL